MKEDLTDRFDARADDDGTVHTILEYTMMVPDNAINDPGPPIKGP